MATVFVLKILIELRPKYIHCYTVACLKRNALRSMYVRYIKWLSCASFCNTVKTNVLCKQRNVSFIDALSFSLQAACLVFFYKFISALLDVMEDIKLKKTNIR